MSTKSVPGHSDFSGVARSTPAPTIKSTGSISSNIERGLSEAAYKANAKAGKRHATALSTAYAKASKVLDK